jgi:hypothetical protein
MAMLETRRMLVSTAAAPKSNLRIHEPPASLQLPFKINYASAKRFACRPFKTYRSQKARPERKLWARFLMRLHAWLSRLLHASDAGNASGSEIRPFPNKQWLILFARKLRACRLFARRRRFEPRCKPSHPWCIAEAFFRIFLRMPRKMPGQDP